MQIFNYLFLLFTSIQETTPFFFDLGALGGCSCQRSCNPPPMMGCQLLCPPTPSPTGCNQNAPQPAQQTYGYPQMYNNYATQGSYQQPSLSYNPPLLQQPQVQQPVPPPPPPPELQRVNIPLSNYQNIRPAPQIPQSAYEIAPTNSFEGDHSDVSVHNSYGSSQQSYGRRNNIDVHLFGNKDQYSTSPSQQLSLQPPDSSYQVDGNVNSNSVGLEQIYQNSHTTAQRVEPSLGVRPIKKPSYETFDENPEIIPSSKHDTYATSNNNKETNLVHDTDLGEYPISAVAEVKTTSVNVQPSSLGSNEWQGNTENWQNGDQFGQFSDSDSTLYSTETPVDTTFDVFRSGSETSQSAGNHHVAKTFEYALPPTRAETFVPSTAAAVYTSSNTESPVFLDEEQSQINGNSKPSTEYDDYGTIDNIEQDSKKGSDQKVDEYFESDNNYEHKKGRNVNENEAKDLTSTEEEEEDSFEDLMPENATSTSTITPTTATSFSTTIATTTTTGVSFLFKKARDLSTYTTKHEATQAGTLGKCNNDKLKETMSRKMSRSASASKQAIFGAATRLFPNQTLNVICSCHSFSYIVVTSPIYCELRKSPLTCFAFVTP